MIEVADSRARRVLGEARGFARGEAGWVLLNVGLASLVAWFAAHGLAGVPAAVLWVLAGVAAGDALCSARSAERAWRELRRLRGNPTYVAAVADLKEAHRRAQRIARTGRADGPAGAGVSR